ncbi:anti-sigma factor RsbA family regulatory protein [Actinoplanes sp. NPDC049599]|uniref:anti-sigma factor RsbA family regulatory protein n=1 Tax=Actinoplanes sp. NPDC049599 TaxID=3363903 RepID=UPI00379F1B27
MSTTPLTHDAMFYDSDQEFADALLPFIRDGIDRGEAVIAAVTKANIASLRDGLGPDATEVSFLDRDQWYQRPASTLAGWQRVLHDATNRGYQRLRLIGEIDFGPAERHTSWTRYESAANDIFAQVPAWIICSYDRRTVPPAVIDDARRTHPTFFASDRPASDAYEPPERFLRAVAEPMPPTSGPPVLSLRIAADVALARYAVAALLEARGWTDTDRGEDLMLAMSEIVTNSIRHGRGRRHLRVWIDGSTVTCEVTDNGAGLADPLAGYRPPSPFSTNGRGLWITQQICDGFGINHADGTTTARFTVTLP